MRPKGPQTVGLGFYPISARWELEMFSVVSQPMVAVSN
jgi:hypothetical protein